MPSSVESTPRSVVPKRGFASRMFGYDIFLSFALGAPPRGTHSYASDLAHRLRERDFTVFFSEDEASPGETLDVTLRTALHDSKVLVVIVNRATLQNPGWIRKEVEEFRRYHPKRPVIPVNIGGALQDPLLAECAQEWLSFQDKIWLNETEQAVETGVASEAVVERLAIAPRHARANVKWRRVTRGVVCILVALLSGLGVATWLANSHSERAFAESRRSVSLRLLDEIPKMTSFADKGGEERALLQLLAAHRIAPGAETYRAALDSLVRLWDLRKISTTNKSISEVAFNKDASRILTFGMRDGLRLWDAKTGHQIGAQLDRKCLKSSFSPDGSRIICETEEDTVYLWDTKVGQQIGTPLKDEVLVSFCPNGSRFVTEIENGASFRLRDAMTGQMIGSLQEHGNEIVTVAFSRDCSRIVSGWLNGAIRLWDANNGKQIDLPISGHNSIVWSVAFSYDGTRIVSGSKDKTVRIWATDTGKQIGKPIEGHKGRVKAVSFTPEGNRVVSIDEDYTVRLWDVGTRLPISILRGKYIEKYPEVICGDNNTIFFRDKSLVRYMDANTGLQGRVFKFDIPVSSYALSCDGIRIVSGSDDGTLRMWDTKTGRQTGPLFGRHQGSVKGVAFSMDGSRIVSVGTDNTLRQWDSTSGEETSTIPEKGKSQTGTKASRLGSGRIMFGSGDGSVRSWEVATGQPSVSPLEASRGGIRRQLDIAVVSGKGNRGAFISSDGVVHVWDVETGQQVGPPFWQLKPASTIALNQDGGKLIAGGADGSLGLWDTNSGKQIEVPFAVHTHDPIVRVVFSPDDSRIASSSWGDVPSTVRLWDANTGKSIGASLETPLFGLKVAFSRDSSRAVAIDDMKNVYLWDSKNWQTISSTDGGDYQSIFLGHVVFNSGGRRIVIVRDRRVRVFDVNSGQQTIEFKVDDPVVDVALSHDDERIIICGEKTETVWDVNMSQQMGPLTKSPSLGMCSAAFSHDNSLEILSDRYGAMRLVEARTRKEIGSLLVEGGFKFVRIAFSQNDSRIISQSGNDALHLWPAPKIWPDELCKKLTRNMSHKEWREWVSPEIEYKKEYVQCPGLPIPLDVPDSIKEQP